MRTKWKEDDQELQVKSPLSGVITAMAPVEDVSLAITTEFKENGSKDLYHFSAMREMFYQLEKNQH
jgi:phosphoribosylformylglycinamidine (FGAM) synthase-like enzyme